MTPFQSSYSIISNDIRYNSTQKSTFLLDVPYCDTEADYGNEVSKFLQATAIRHRDSNPLDW